MSIYRVYHYENSVVPYKHVLLKGDRIRKNDLTKMESKEREEKRRENMKCYDEKISESLSRSKRVISELALCNTWDYFCTFEFNEMKTVRNKISHMSEQADSKFKLLVSQKLSNSEIESVGEFLDTNKTSRSTYFEYYTEQILEYVRVISNRSLETR